MKYEYRIKFQFKIFPGQKAKNDFVRIHSKEEMTEEEIKEKILKDYKYPGMKVFKPCYIKINKIIKSYLDKYLEEKERSGDYGRNKYQCGIRQEN